MRSWAHPSDSAGILCAPIEILTRIGIIGFLEETQKGGGAEEGSGEV